MEKIQKLLTDKGDNYIFPFLWMHGEEEGIIREYVGKIAESGIRALCVEPRPHPDYVGEAWWRDLGIVLDEAEKRQMKVWLFDDAHFPTGYANGAILKKHPHLRKKYLKINQTDYHGPQKDAGIIVKWQAGGKRQSIMEVGTDNHQLKAELTASEDQIIAVLMAKVIDYQTVDTTTMVDISQSLVEGTIYLDLPAGNWRVFTLVETFEGGESSTEGYLNPLDEVATQVLIEEVYESHQRHVGEHFGKTIAGFFTDEPRFGNIKGPDAIIGQDMLLPWRSDMLSLLQKELKEEALLLLPLLVVNGNHKTDLIRFTYMDTVSTLYAKNFTKKIADWCTSHQLEYVGHLIEDNNAHARLGYGAGHYFRAIEDQTMAGIDVVLHQLLPGQDQGYFKSFTSTGWDGEFFHYALAKMGTSLAYLDPKKQGRTMVELYGAYGWSEGLKLMKWMTDHMLVRGVNHFVPHAFNMSPFPDADCPPHFYAHGENPQYPHLAKLMNYTNRVAELLSDGQPVTSAFLLYHGEAEWSGEAMLMQKPAKELTQHQLDFTIISLDLLKQATKENGRLQLNGLSAKVLIVPYGQRFPRSFVDECQEMLAAGIEVLFIKDYPLETTEGGSAKAFQQAGKIALEELVNHLKEAGHYDIRSLTPQKDLRFYHYRQPDSEVLMFFNEGQSSLITTIALQETDYLHYYDAMKNELFLVGDKPVSQIEVSLASHEAAHYILAKERLTDHPLINYQSISSTELTLPWNVSLYQRSSTEKFAERQLADLVNLASPAYFPDFSGKMVYQTEFDLAELAEGDCYLDLGQVYEIATVFLNGTELETKISGPYEFKLGEHIRPGRNSLRVEVINTLGTEMKDYLSQYRLLEPSGLIGPVRLVVKHE
ncbi:glycoside hydrolase family 2 [Vagococcus sp. BWB3-3]|uniref:Glycoside hydrolase family 2 n=1 Tax=Vagococcus allomyrinae TaxID=2794353 RepID=A0A940PH76_9ENTE|nr:glycoside hydrolase family 2 [Vagococcus allomyrinae]MBP1042863.1 glycoside hydrolase family 2 [Vagococcus allomyrinae]